MECLRKRKGCTIIPNAYKTVLLGIVCGVVGVWLPFLVFASQRIDEHDQGNNPIYVREFQNIMEGLDEEGCIEESGHVSEKKRRLSVDQVKALEKNFEVENKLEPERKVKLAQELGLQPRQVAVWFQNRRARWKTKQLEKDYGVLKANYDSLKHNFDKLQHDNETLLQEIQEVRSKLNENGMSESKVSVKEEGNKCNHEAPLDSIAKSEEGHLNGMNNAEELLGVASDSSDSSAILNEDINNNSPTAAISSSAGILHHSPRPHQFLGSTSSINLSYQFSDTKTTNGATTFVGGDTHKAVSSYQPQFVKIEEHNFFGEDSCSTFVSDVQAPTLHWYNSEDWN